MAVGTGFGFDVNALQKALDALDKNLAKVIQKGEDANKAFAAMFKGKDGIAFNKQLVDIKKNLELISREKDPLKWNSKDLGAYVDQINRMVHTVEKMNQLAGTKGYKKIVPIDTSELQNIQKELLATYREVTKLEQKAEKQRTARNQTYSGALRFSDKANTLEKERQAIENLKVARDKLKQSDVDYADKLNRLNEAILKHEKHLRDATKTNNQKAEEDAKVAQRQLREEQRLYEERARLRREENKKKNQTYEGAIAFSSTAKTLNREIQAVKNLEAARAKLSKTDADYEKKVAALNRHIKQHNNNIEKATKGAKELREQHRSLGDAAGGIGRALAGMFSVRAIRGYINEMIKVRGEMELQQRSLQAILQDKDKADEIWQKTIDLAVKSPFRIKDLVTYTKQLAAYRVEADKLYDTNKMLADVSSGLGVDMSRLILAFGQVKAANYLRGTELRQFSEAGINMLGELSKYFTELEGRAVSVGDVFERISKRMVSFSDVEEIFKRITSEGGTFYRMQEIQAETLRGQISNLKDSVDIMINEMGKANDGVLKNMVSIFKGIVDNWRTISATVVPIIGALITRWSLFRIVTKQNGDAIAGFVKTFGKHFGVVITQLTRGTRVAKQFAKSTQVSIMGGWTTVILAVAAAIVTVVKAMQNANRVKKELEKIDISGAFDASRSVAEYKRLAEVVSDTSKSYDEQQKALSTLKNKYADILPAHMLEAKTIKDMKGDYDAATQAIYDYIAAKTKEKQIGIIQTEFGTDVEEQAGDLADDIKKALAKVAPNITRADVLPIVNRLQEMIQLGEVNVLNVDEVIQNLVRQFTGLEISTDAWKYTFAAANGEMVTLENNAESLVIAMGKMKNAMDEVTSSSLNWMDSFIYQDFNKVKEGYEEQSKAIGKYYDTIRKYQEQQEGGVRAGEVEIKEDEAKAATEALNKIFTDANREAPKWNEIINEPFKLNEATVTANKLLWAQMIDDINKMPVLPSKVGAKQNYVEALTEEMEGFSGSAKQQEVARIAQELADSLSVSLEGLDELFLKSDESLTDYAKRITGTLEQYKQGVLEFDNDVKNGTKLGEYTEEQVGLMREQIPFLQKFLELFSAFLKPKKGKTEDTFTPMLRTVKELYTEFKKLQGSFDDLTAKEGALAKFGDAFKEAFGKTPEQMGFDLFSEEGVKAAYDYLISKAPDAKKKIQAELAKGEVVWDVKLEKKKEDDDKLKESVERMFDQYDLSLSLDKLNVPQDLAKNLFNIDTTSLDELRSKITSMEGEFVGKGMKKQYDEYLAKINEMEQKAQEERLKTYVEYARKAIGERAKIKLEELRKLKEIEETFEEKEGDSEETKQYKRNMAKDASAQVKKEADQELKRLDWQEFEKSDMFVNLFKDLEGASDSLLNHAIKKLQSFKEEWKDMPLEDVRQIVEKMNELEDALINIQPIRQMKEAKKKVKDAIEEAQKNASSYFESSDAKEKFGDGKKKGAFMQAIQEESVYQEKQKADAQKQITYIETALRLLEGKANENDKLLQDEKEIRTYMKLGEKALRGQLTTQKGIITNADRILARNEDIVDTNQDYNKGLKKVADYMDDAIGMANDLYGAFKDLSVALGADEDSPAMIFADMGMSIMSSIPQMLSLIATIHTATTAAKGLGTAMNMAMGIVGLIVMGIQLVVEAINAIAKANDNKIVAQLEEQAEIIERQRDIYEQLEERVEKAYNVSQLQQFNKELERSVELEIQALEASIALEKSRKNADEEQIKQYEEEIAEARKRLVESTQEMMEEMGGIFDLTDFASGFVDAWWDAMEEGKSGLDALSEHFDETMADMVKKQALYKGASKIMEQLQNAINAGLENDYSIDQAEWDAIVETAKKANIDLDKFLMGYRAMFEELSLGSEGGLSGLQKGISGMSEQQAEILTAYWNSVRGYTASIDSKMDLILANMGVGAENNPMLEQLISQTSWLSKIHNILDGLTTSSSVAVGRRIKVTM